MKRLLTLLGIVTIIAGCSSGSSGSTAACKQQYWDGAIGVCLPEKWNVIDRETLQARGVPDEVVTAFQSSQLVSGQNPTVTVTKETLKSKTEPSDYSAASIRAVAGLPGYKLIDSRKATVDGKSVQIHVFSAQPLPEEPERRFYQVSSTSDMTGYTLTALTPLSVSSSLESEIRTIFTTLTFVDPASKEQSAK